MKIKCTNNPPPDTQHIALGVWRMMKRYIDMIVKEKEQEYRPDQNNN